LREDLLIVEQIELKNGKTIRLVKGDITTRDVDAVVNASNSNLMHGGGVAAAIVRKGGQIIQEESDKIGFVPGGSAAITTCGKGSYSCSRTKNG
jgi:O-acetyl-ADP-ribose deacetylase (regulator of RNase III)